MKLNKTGEFRCRNNGLLFYVNKTRVVSNQTKCLATAQWKDSDVVQCWTGVVLFVVIYNVMPGSFVGVVSKCVYIASILSLPAFMALGYSQQLSLNNCKL